MSNLPKKYRLLSQAKAPLVHTGCMMANRGNRAVKEKLELLDRRDTLGLQLR
jgi:hypothetical protein